MISSLVTDIKSVKMTFAKVVIVNAVPQHVVGRDQLAMSDGHDRSFRGVQPNDGTGWRGMYLWCAWRCPYRKPHPPQEARAANFVSSPFAISSRRASSSSRSAVFSATCWESRRFVAGSDRSGSIRRAARRFRSVFMAAMPSRTLRSSSRLGRAAHRGRIEEAGLAAQPQLGAPPPEAHY